MKTDIWIHLIEVAHVGITDIVHLLEVLSLRLICVLLRLSKHSRDELVNALIHVTFELFLFTECWENSYCFRVLLV